MRALVISGGGEKGRSLEVSHNIFRKKKMNMIFYWYFNWKFTHSASRPK
jgi:hypothetical protein